MPNHRQELIQPYRCEDLFELVLDIERYPEFVPGWRSARVLERDMGWLRVEQHIGIGPLRLSFESRATYERPDSIRIESAAAPFRHLCIDWRFHRDQGGCRIEFDSSLSLLAMNRFATPLLELMGSNVIAAFKRRAAQQLAPVGYGQD
ncbi:MAG: type II toxin-antitoxin system RatA family toxin [Gammaproteobacteria bacterium]|nr:type II toxin-antitoxin system RatA family toxin [Gammaproteobacteria bacterium]